MGRGRGSGDTEADPLDVTCLCSSGMHTVRCIEKWHYVKNANFLRYHIDYGLTKVNNG